MCPMVLISKTIICQMYANIVQILELPYLVYTVCTNLEVLGPSATTVRDLTVVGDVPKH